MSRWGSFGVGTGIVPACCSARPRAATSRAVFRASRYACMEATGSWLCPTSLARARVVEASPRVRRARTVSAGAVGVALLVLAPHYGLWTVGLFALACVNLGTVDLRLRRSSRPERVALGSFAIILTLIATGIALSGGSHSPVLS